MSQELKPCPFCGSDAHQNDSGIYCSQNNGTDVGIGCPASVPYFTPEQWNRRASSLPVTDGVWEALELASASLKSAAASLSLACQETGNLSYTDPWEKAVTAYEQSRAALSLRTAPPTEEKQ